MQKESEQKADFLRGISYDDQRLGDMTDEEPTLRANEKRHNISHTAVCKIQLWWRIVYAIRASKMREQEKLTNENKIEEHCQSYARDLFCIPCGRRYGSRDELYKHILKEESHDHAVSDYNKFISYKKSVVDIWLKQAEDLLDQEVMGRPIAEIEVAKSLQEFIAKIIISLRLIERTYDWAKLEDLRESINQLQNAYRNLDEQVLELDGRQIISSFFMLLIAAFFAKPHLSPCIYVMEYISSDTLRVQVYLIEKYGDNDLILMAMMI